MKKIAISSFFLMLFVISACQDDYAPKPEGYFRIALPEKTYDTLNHPCGYQFEMNEAAKFVPRDSCWGDVVYPRHRATLQLTYKSVQDNKLSTLLDDGHRLAYEHTVKAAGIDEQLIYDEENRVFGVLYNIKGNAATNAQFFVTDSSRHFLRGALYFYAVPNADSLQPVNDFMRAEILRMINTLEWKNS